MPSPLPRRAYLGARLPPDDQAFEDGGLRVAGALDGGMAAAAGMTAGDVLVELAGTQIGSMAALRQALRQAGGLARASLRFVHGDRVRDEIVEVVPHPIEPGARYGALDVAGARLRTITTGPAEPRGAVLVLQGIACESIDLAMRPDEPLAGLIRGWNDAGYQVVRVDKRGIGDSEGEPCADQDFDTELADMRAAAAAFTTTRGPHFVFGHSVGGMIAALLAPALELAGLMVYGTSAARWLDCIVDTTRRQLAFRGRGEAAIERHVADLRERASRDGLNGRTGAYHRQLDAVDLVAAWRRVPTPRILVLHGENDWVVSRREQQQIVELLGSERAQLVDLPGLDHMFGWHPTHAHSLADYGAGRFDPIIVRRTLEWMRSLPLC